MSDLSRDTPGTCDRFFFFFQANKNSWILWVNNDDVQTTEHKSAVPLISFCKRNIFFSFLEGKRWWRRSHRWLTCYSFYADSVYIFNYTCIWFLFPYLFLVCSTNGMRCKKKRFLGGSSCYQKLWQVNTKLQTHLPKEFSSSILFSQYQLLKEY